MERVTKADVTYWFDRLCAALGKSKTPWRTEDGKSVANIGAWYLDHNPIYGGYVVYEMMNEGGGAREPFGPYRKRPAEFVAAVRFALDAIEIDRQGRK